MKTLLLLAFAIVCVARAAPAQTNAQINMEVRPFSNWTLTCLPPAAAGQPKRCSILQVVGSGPDNRQAVLAAAVNYDETPLPPTFQFRFSGNADPKAGMAFRVDEGPIMEIAIASCDGRTCTAKALFAEPVESQFRSGQRALIALRVADGQQVTLPLPLDGFAPALDELRRELRNPPQ
jgi:invasion protein IalB